jgi:transcription termination factor Rho
LAGVCHLSPGAVYSCQILIFIKEKKHMNVAEIRDIAKTMGIKAVGRMKKREVIHAIQHHEDNDACFGAPWRLECGENDCLWRRDCQNESS